MKDFQLESGGPPGLPGALPSGPQPVSREAEGWRAVTRVLRSSFDWAGGAVRSGISDIANVLMPSDCRLCGAAMVSLGRVRVCEACVALVGVRAAGSDGASCSRCGDAMGFESARMMSAMGVSECTMCRLAPPAFERAVNAGDYDDEMREMLHLLKFAGRRAVAELVLGERLAAAIASLGELQGMVVVPVPLFAARERERGFNQAELLARAAVRRMRPKLKVEAGALVRVKDTRALYTLSPKQRRDSLKGAFRVANTAAVVGRVVLLVDDVMTTGATARECARVLKRAGAAKVFVATAAKAQPAGSVAAYREGDVAMWDAGAKPAVEPDISRRQSF